MLIVPECLYKDGVASNYWAHVFFPWPEYKGRQEIKPNTKMQKDVDCRSWGGLPTNYRTLVHLPWPKIQSCDFNGTKILPFILPPLFKHKKYPILNPPPFRNLTHFNTGQENKQRLPQAFRASNCTSPPPPKKKKKDSQCLNRPCILSRCFHLSHLKNEPNTQHFSNRGFRYVSQWNSSIAFATKKENEENIKIYDI